MTKSKNIRIKYNENQIYSVNGVRFKITAAYANPLHPERGFFRLLECPGCKKWRKVPNNVISGIKTGRQRGYCMSCSAKRRSAEKCYRWGGGISYSRGYRNISESLLQEEEKLLGGDSLMRTSKKWGAKRIREHILLKAIEIGRVIITLIGECVHHINGIKTDNFKTNLLLCDSIAEHSKIEASMYPEARDELLRAYRAIDAAGVEFEKKAIHLMPMQYQLEQGRITPEEVEASLIFQRRAEDPNWRDNPKLNKILS